MHFSTGPSRNSWQPTIGSNTAEASYWLNWRFLLCALWVLFSIAIASVLIWRYEGSEHEVGEVGEGGHETKGALYKDESWRPCLTTIHPAWLLAFRGIAFPVCVALLVSNILVDGGGSIMYYYTEWTFLLVTVYFGLGLLLSAYGCHQFLKVKINSKTLDGEHGTYTAPRNSETANGTHTAQNHIFQDYLNIPKVAGLGSYLLQIIYQTNAGAVMLTDFTFWIYIFPFIDVKDHTIYPIGIPLHSVNAVLLLGDTALNSLRFPLFRIAYFVLWTSIYVIFQWVLHACISIWWPYPFLDLSSPYAPIWYFALAVAHFPCYAVYPLILKLKHSLLVRWFPHSYCPAS